MVNRGKESVALNLKQADDLQILKNMISKADIFIQNLMPGRWRDWACNCGFVPPTHLITCDISGYGSEGPFQR